MLRLLKQAPRSVRECSLLSEVSDGKTEVGYLRRLSVPIASKKRKGSRHVVYHLVGEVFSGFDGVVFSASLPLSACLPSIDYLRSLRARKLAKDCEQALSDARAVYDAMASHRRLNLSRRPYAVKGAPNA